MTQNVDTQLQYLVESAVKNAFREQELETGAGTMSVKRIAQYSRDDYENESDLPEIQMPYTIVVKTGLARQLGIGFEELQVIVHQTVLLWYHSMVQYFKSDDGLVTMTGNYQPTKTIRPVVTVWGDVYCEATDSNGQLTVTNNTELDDISMLGIITTMDAIAVNINNGVNLNSFGSYDRMVIASKNSGSKKRTPKKSKDSKSDGKNKKPVQIQTFDEVSRIDVGQPIMMPLSKVSLLEYRGKTSFHFFGWEKKVVALSRGSRADAPSNTNSGTTLGMSATSITVENWDKYNNMTGYAIAEQMVYSSLPNFKVNYSAVGDEIKGWFVVFEKRLTSEGKPFNAFIELTRGKDITPF